MPKSNSGLTTEPQSSPDLNIEIKKATHAFIEDIRNQPPKIFCSIRAAGVALDLGKTSIYALLRDEKIFAVKHGNRTLIYLQSVLEYAASLGKSKGTA